MARTLKITIQVFWATFGTYSIVALVEMLGFRLFGHSSHPLGWVGILFLMPMVLLFVAIAYTAYVAVFRFTDAVIAPSVFVVSVIMFATAMHGVNHQFQPLIEPSEGPSPSIMPFVALALFFLICVAPFRYYRLTVPAIRKMLFPPGPLFDVQPG